MKRKIALQVFLIVMTVTVSAQVNPLAGVYKYCNTNGTEGTISVSTGQNGNIYFEASAITPSGNNATIKPENKAWQRLVGNKVSYTKYFEQCAYTITLTFNIDAGTLTVAEKYDKWAPIFGKGVSFNGTYNKDASIIGDNKGYLYSVMSDGTLGVAKGGRYCGIVRIPESIKMPDGTEKIVSTIRKYAMQVPLYERSTNSLHEVIVPSTVSMVGVDAFYGNYALEKVTYDNPNNVYVEAGAYMGCPNLMLSPKAPIYGYCDMMNEDRNTVFSRFIYPTSEVIKGTELAKYKWVCFKHWHNRIGNPIGHNIGKEDAMECYATWNKVKGYIYSLRDTKQGPNMFWGYHPGEIVVMMTDNDYMGKHHFPQFNRWKYGEDTIFMSNHFKSQMENRYGKKVKYSCKAAELREDGRNVSVTEFEISNEEALVVIAWSCADEIICTWEKRRKFESGEDDKYGLWNVDDDGVYGIPSVICIAEGDDGVVEILLNHPAPESKNIIHLVRNGHKLEEQGGDQWYVWYD